MMAEGLVLLDLDGTLTDPFEGIYRSVLYALDRLGLPPIDEAHGRRWIGPPLYASFLALTGDAVEADRAVGFYRERFGETGLYENTLLPGIPEALDAMAAAGFRMAVATSKYEPFAERIVDHFGLGGRIAAVYGADSAGTRAEKSLLVAHALASEGLAAGGHAVMVGDREHDILGARANALPAVGVAWGYAAPGEFERHPPDRLVSTPVELPAAAAELLARTEAA